MLSFFFFFFFPGLVKHGVKKGGGKKILEQFCLVAMWSQVSWTDESKFCGCNLVGSDHEKKKKHPTSKTEPWKMSLKISFQN